MKLAYFHLDDTVASATICSEFLQFRLMIRNFDCVFGAFLTERSFFFFTVFVNSTKGRLEIASEYGWRKLP
jgi:hypothetical protein